MREYYGRYAQFYSQSLTKKISLIPAILRAIPKRRNKRGLLLDVACGNGDLFPLAINQGYKYFGLDKSPAMLKRAIKAYPNGNYIISSSTDFSSKYKDKFDVVLINMLFPSLNDRAKIISTLREARRVLKKRGIIIIGTAHPSFDRYMSNGLFVDTDVITNFRGYYSSGQKYSFQKKFKNGAMTFINYHWQLQDYFQCIVRSNLEIINIDECLPEKSKAISERLIVEKKKHPHYIVFTTINKLC